MMTLTALLLVTGGVYGPGWTAIALAPLFVLALFGFRKKRAAAALSSAHASSPAAYDAIDEETIVILTAAVSETLQKPIRVRRIQFLHDDGASAWSVTGRLGLMGSHLITRRKL
jgi:hypothetical protein